MKIAPIQIVIIPILRSKNDKKKIKLYLEPMVKSLMSSDIRVHVDWTKNTPGFKFNECKSKRY